MTATSPPAAKREERGHSPDRVVRSISKNVADLREERGFSLQELANRAGLSKSHVWEIENGRQRNPTVSTVVALGRALGVSVDYLTGLSTTQPDLHPEAMRLACEIDSLLRKKRA